MATSLTKIGATVGNASLGGQIRTLVWTCAAWDPIEYPDTKWAVGDMGQEIWREVRDRDPHLEVISAKI